MSEARVRGYRDYYDNARPLDCPYDYCTEYEQWCDWADGWDEAYCEDEDK